jgi:hypothetical protein
MDIARDLIRSVKVDDEGDVRNVETTLRKVRRDQNGCRTSAELAARAWSAEAAERCEPGNRDSPEGEIAFFLTLVALQAHDLPIPFVGQEELSQVDRRAFGVDKDEDATALLPFLLEQLHEPSHTESMNDVCMPLDHADLGERLACQPCCCTRGRFRLLA